MADNDLYERIVNDERPIAARRNPRRSIGPNIKARSNPQPEVSRPHGISTPPATPKRSKKRVRFSEPGPENIDTESASSGLTPFIQRTSISTIPTLKRRHSTTAALLNRADYDISPISRPLHLVALRQVLDDRVKRRLRRNRLSEEMNEIEWEKRIEARQKRSEVERLRREVAAGAIEIQSLRSQIEGASGGSITTYTTLCAKVQELEKENMQLKTELQRRESDTEDDPNWAVAARDPFDFNDDDDNMITNYDEDFMMNDEMITTPTRLNTSFPSPPSTMPNTPCKSVSSMNAGIQVSLPVPDPENGALKSQLQSLQSEISKFTAAIAFNDDNETRLAQKLSDFIPAGGSHDHTSLDSALDSVLTQLALSQSHALEKSTAFSALTNEIKNLGFPSCSGPEQTLETIASQFRQARLDLEYLTPGENPEGFENDKLLDMLVSRIKVLVQKVKEKVDTIKERDSTIDQYHEQEVLLRQQIDTRVTVMEEMRKELSLANSICADLRSEIQEKETSNERLKEALEGYRTEVSGLEKLIERIEGEGRESATSLNQLVAAAQEKHDALKVDNENKALLLAELEERLASVLCFASELEAQLASLTTTHSSCTSTISHLQLSASEREKAHGNALALRDARVSELREEVARVNTSLKNAHGIILNLRNENKELVAQSEGEKSRGEYKLQNMRDQVIRAVMRDGDGYPGDENSVLGPRREGNEENDGRRGSSIEGGPIEPMSLGVVREPPRMMDTGLARRSGNGKKRRRYDSGMGFLDEEDEGALSSDI
ncbi:hypothetical protein BGZ57DRAFT_859098 [Hyaloscypha finlandica]|nr:hypothetical protein BGZ57DRAFT_859098 [Hyaloscypha finlandica]